MPNWFLEDFCLFLLVALPWTFRTVRFSPGDIGEKDLDCAYVCIYDPPPLAHLASISVGNPSEKLSKFLAPASTAVVPPLCKARD